MKSAILCCLLAVSFAAPQRDAQIIRDERVDNGDGSFSYAFAADNGIEMEVVGNPGFEGQINMQGYYLLPLESGGFARVEFVADENGFQPWSDILPTPPPLPEHVLELLHNTAIHKHGTGIGITFD